MEPHKQRLQASLGAPVDKSIKRDRLWNMAPDLIPGHDALPKPEEPGIYVYLPPPEHATKTGVLVFPGGRYSSWAADTEGFNVAHFLNARGVAAFVVYYRNSLRCQYPVPLLDAQGALRLVRSRAGQYQLDDRKIGVMGFSAGATLPPPWQRALTRAIRQRLTRWTASRAVPILSCWRTR